MEKQIISEKNQQWLEKMKTNSVSKNELKLILLLSILVRFLFSRFFLILISSIPFLVSFGVLTNFFGFNVWTCSVYLIVHFLFYELYLKKDLDNFSSDYFLQNEVIRIFKERLRNDEFN
jgi:hypothetical protein